MCYGILGQGRKMNPEVKIADTGLEKYPKSRIILGNVLMFLGIVVGTIAFWFFFSVFAVLYLIFAIILVYVVLRKLVCTNCYYYDKWCSMGWGKLAAAMFKKGKTEDFNDSIGLKLAPVVYGLLTIIPIIVIIISIILVFDYSKIVILAFLLFFAVYSGGVSRRAACSSCKMRSSCKGSAVK